MAEASRLLRKPHVLKPPARGENPEFDRKLADPTVAFAPLYLTMACVTAVQEGIPTLLTRGRAEMAQRIATDELSRIEKLARDRDVNRDLLKYLAVGVTLAGGWPREELVDCIAAERAALGYALQDDVELANAACDVLGVQLDRVSPILPDLIGEAAILEQLTKLPKQKQGQIRHSMVCQSARPRCRYFGPHSPGLYRDRRPVAVVRRNGRRQVTIRELVGDRRPVPRGVASIS